MWEARRIGGWVTATTPTGDALVTNWRVPMLICLWTNLFSGRRRLMGAEYTDIIPD